jgi:uncharacterized membrane protein YgcG
LKSLIIILTGLAFSFYFSDIRAENSFYSVICPIGIFIFLFSFLIWNALRNSYGNGGNSSGDSGGGFSSSGGDCGGDGGCGD